MHRFKVFIAILTVSLFSFLSWNCTKIDTTSIGSGLIPPVDNVHTFDTSISVIAINYDNVNECDTLYRHSEHALGFISNDPHFGKTNAGIFLELKPTSFPFGFPNVRDSIFGDSVVLVLQHTRTFGDSLLPQKVNVFMLQQNTFKVDSNYTSCFTAPYFSNVLGSAIYTPIHFADTIKTFGDTSINELRIKLSNQFSSTLFSQDSSTWFKNDSIYKLNFPGLAVLADPSFGGNALSYFNLDSPKTRLVLYYRYVKGGIKDTVFSSFTFNSLTGEANSIARDRTGADINAHLSHNTAGDDLVYIQTSPGSYANLTIPGLNSLSNRIVVRADLIMESLPINPLEPFAAPDFLYIQTKDSSLGGAYHPIPCDFFVSANVANFSSFGGYKTTTRDDFGNNVNKYDFNITRYVQNFITKGRSDMNLRLSAPSHVFSNIVLNDYCNQSMLPFNFSLNANAYGRVILGGGSNTNYKMKLRIIYSKI